jgi:hypothetical protein
MLPLPLPVEWWNGDADAAAAAADMLNDLPDDPVLEDGVRLLGAGIRLLPDGGEEALVPDKSGVPLETSA